MALTRLDLSIELTKATDCSDITLTDDTGTYDVTTNPLGYGLPSGITVNNVTGLIITVNMSSGIYFTYTCVVASGVINSCLLSVNGGTGTEIVSLLASTTFPVTDFSLFDEDYGVTLPELEDSIVEVDYNITGSSGEDTFNYLTSDSVMISCDICCCKDKLLLSIDPNCDCSSDAMQNYLRVSTYLEIAEMNMDIGKNDIALINLNKAIEICNCGCSDC